MAGSKKKDKHLAQARGKHVALGANPDAYYSMSPSWNFNRCDKDNWSLLDEKVRSLFWSEILPHLQELEKLKWSDILVKAKKHNHGIDLDRLNKCARDRLLELQIFPDEIISLRVTGTHRIYGCMMDGVFNILWVDLDHGDNPDCVCRSRMKHT